MDCTNCIWNCPDPSMGCRCNPCGISEWGGDEPLWTGVESQIRPLWVLSGCFGKSWWVPVWGPPRLTPWGQWLQPWEENLVIDGLLLISECSVFPSFPHSFFQTLILLRYRKLIKAVLSCRKFVFLTKLSQELKRVIGNPSRRGKRTVFEKSSKTQTDFCARKTGRFLREGPKRDSHKLPFPRDFSWSREILIQESYGIPQDHSRVERYSLQRAWGIRSLGHTAYGVPCRRTWIITYR